MSALEFYKHLHQIPELSEKEFETSKYIFNKLKAFGYSPKIVGDTGVYADLTYDDMRAYSQNVSAAQVSTGLPLILYWNYEYGVDISNRAGKPNGNWNDRGTGTEYSWNTANFEKARIILAAVKAHNDAWDAANA